MVAENTPTTRPGLETVTSEAGATIVVGRGSVACRNAGTTIQYAMAARTAVLTPQRPIFSLRVHFLFMLGKKKSVAQSRGQHDAARVPNRENQVNALLS